MPEFKKFTNYAALFIVLMFSISALFVLLSNFMLWLDRVVGHWMGTRHF